jgi:hypothetical protein
MKIITSLNIRLDPKNLHNLAVPLLSAHYKVAIRDSKIAFPYTRKLKRGFNSKASIFMKFIFYVLCSTHFHDSIRGSLITT